MHLAQAVDASRIEQDALGQRGLAGIDVGHDADIADLFDAILRAIGHSTAKSANVTTALRS